MTTYEGHPDSQPRPDFIEETLFDLKDYDTWREHWQDMPQFDSDRQMPYDSINVQFSCAEDRREFLLLMGEDVQRRMAIWYPSHARRIKPKITRTETIPPSRYPIYIISKGRADTRFTAKSLDKLGLPYRIVIEPQEYDAYNEHIDAKQILVLPFSNLGLGSIPARNFVWEHSITEGHERHWILDDNIDGFYRLNNNNKTLVAEENPFTSIEDFVDRYENIPMAGMQYDFFAPEREKHSAVRFNTRVYSCILLSNTLIEHRWRGRYNEDTDLSIRILKDGWATALFYHYLCKKKPTMTVKGGNTEQLYVQDSTFDGRLEMARSLQLQHPEIVEIKERWGRWQHVVDYSAFQANPLIKKKGAK